MLTSKRAIAIANLQHITAGMDMELTAQHIQHEQHSLTPLNPL
jgi:hypothetical protein